MVVYPYPAEEEDRIVFISYSNTRTHALVNGTKAVFDFITEDKYETSHKQYYNAYIAMDVFIVYFQA